MLKFSLNFKKIVLLGILLLLLLYAVFFLNTNSVMRYAKSVFRGEISSEEVVGTPLYRYYPDDPEVVKVDLNLKRIFVSHNFKDGYIWVKYDVAQMDSSGYEAHGSRDIISRWKIHKENGEWKVVDIDEDP